MNLVRKYLIICLIAFTSFISLYGQKYQPYNWEENRSFTEGVDAKEGLVLIKNHVQYDYEYEEGNLVCYKTYHKIYRANDDQAVKRVNRIYIPMNETIELVATKARTITKDGRVTILNKDNIKQVKDEEVGSGYSIFAIEGAEVGGDIEYFYTSKVNTSFFGREYVQFDYPVINTTFAVATPINLKFDFKSYNGLREVEVTEDQERNFYKLTTERTPLLREEQFGTYSGNRQRIEFKLSYNTVSGKQRLFTWSDAGKRIFELLYPITNTEEKAVNNLIKEMKLQKSENTIGQLAFAEHYIKTNFYIDNQAGGNSEDLSQAIKNRFTTERGYVRLFLALLEAMEIDFQLVMTSSRKSIPFDGSFESWNYLADYLIYITQPDQFLAPYDFEVRLGSIPSEYSPGEGLFMKSINFEGVSSVVTQVKKIPEISYKENFDNLQIKVAFSEDLSENIVEVERSFKGYTADYLKVANLKGTAEQKDQIFKNVLEYLSPEAKIESIYVKEANTDYTVWQAPFTLAGKFNTQGFIEQAGDIVLFNVGGLIGPQSELYQEYERTNPVENDYNRGYLRTIEVDLPEGLSVQNLEDLNMDVKAENEGKVVYLFKSAYELNGSKLSISIDEYYDQIHFPLERFEEFRKVINAAADWNKITLVLQPEQE